MGIGGTPQELVETWRTDTSRPVNIGSATGRWGTTLFLEGFGTGIVAQFLKAASKRKKPEGADNLRKGRMLLQKVLKDAEPFDIVMKIDGKSFERSVLGVEVCNIAFTGPGLPIATSANSGDGKLDVIASSPTTARTSSPGSMHRSDEKPPVTSRKAAKVELIWRAAPNRVDDAYFNGKDKDEEQSVEIACDKETGARAGSGQASDAEMHEKAAAE